MIQRDNEVKKALLLQRIFVCPSQTQVTEKFLLTLATAFNEHSEGIGDSRLVQLEECEKGREAVLYAESGVAVHDQPTDSLLAVYVAKGLIEKTVENMNHLRSRGTIDFVGKLQIAVESEPAMVQRDEIRGELSATEHSEAVLENRSDVYDRIESVFAFCFEGPQQSIDSLCQLELKDLTRLVSQPITH